MYDVRYFKDDGASIWLFLLVTGGANNVILYACRNKMFITVNTQKGRPLWKIPNPKSALKISCTPVEKGGERKQMVLECSINLLIKGQTSMDSLTFKRFLSSTTVFLTVTAKVTK